MTKTDGKVQNFLDDDAYMEVILSANDEEILDLVKTEYVDPIEEAEKLGARLISLVEAYGGDKVRNPTDLYLKESIEMMFIALEKIQAAQNESVRQMFDGLSQTTHYMENEVLALSSSFNEEFERVHAGMYSQIADITRQVALAMTDSTVFGQAQSLTQYANKTQSQMMAMNKSIEDMQQRTDRLRVSLKLQSEELISSLRQILKHLTTSDNAVIDGALQGQASGGYKRIRIG